MNVRLFANTSKLSLTERLEGGSFQPPLIPAYQGIQMRFKLAEVVNSAATLDKRPLSSLVARIGWPDTAPTSGSYQLEITHGGTTVTTADIAHNADATAIAAAINTAISGIAVIHPCTVTEYEGLFRIVFEDKDQQPTIECVENSLWPASFVDVDEIEFDEGWAYVLQLRQAPVAETVTFSEEVPAAPEITELQAGSEVDSYAINAIQKLSISPAFAGGSFLIVRDGKKTAPIAVPVDIAKLRAGVQAIADEGGAFVVTEVNDGAYLEFTGTMGGMDQDLMTVEVFESPEVDYFFHLPTRTDSMRALMRNVDTAGQVRIPLNLQLEIEDEAAPDGIHPVTISQDLVFIRPVSTGEHNVAASLVWNQPLSRRDHLSHSTDSLLIGNRAITRVIGNGVDTSFTIPHNLLENSQTFTTDHTTDTMTATGHGFDNGDPVHFANSGGALPTGLTAGVTYFIVSATADTFKVATSPGGSAVNLTSNGTGTNTVVLRDGTIADAVMVQVWKTGGSKELVPDNAYTVTRPSNNSVVVSGFASTPTSGQYQVNVMTVGRPATYQHHIHPLDDSPETKARIEALEARVSVLEDLVGPGISFSPASSPSAPALSRALKPVWFVPRIRTLPEMPATLLDWSPYTLESPLRSVKLQRAFHDATTEALPTPLPDPSAVTTPLVRVFSTSSDRTDFPGGGLKAGDYGATDGREWIRVFKEASSESTYYPAAFSDLVLFRTWISENELTARSIMDLLLGIELALYPDPRNPRDRFSVCSCALKIEFGTATADSTPGTPGTNLDTWFTSPVIALEQRILITDTPTQHRAAIQVIRDAAGALTAKKSVYRGALVSTNAPASANFAVRGRLCRWDVEDAPTDARAIIAVRGLDVGLDGQPDTTLGKVTIS